MTRDFQVCLKVFEHLLELTNLKYMCSLFYDENMYIFQICKCILIRDE